MLALVTAVYGSLIALLMLIAAFSVVKLRRTRKVGLGDGGDEQIAQAMRVHANIAEYAPISLLLLLFLELNQASNLWLHVFGSVLVIARALHIWGFSRHKNYSHGRFVGTLLTWLNIVAMALANVFLVLRTV